MKTGMIIRKTLRRAGIDIGRWPRPHDLDGAIATVLTQQRINLVLDVGANIGQFGGKMRRLGYAGRLVSFEPSDAALPVLADRADGDDAWDIRPLALGAASGSATMHRYEGSDFNSLHAALPAGRERFSAMAEVATETVQVSTLATERLIACAGLECPRILLKSDTQGHDLEVLAGDPGLPDVAAVLVELSAQPIYEGQPSMAAVLDVLAAEGFHPVAFQPVNRAADRLSVIEFDGLFIR